MGRVLIGALLVTAAAFAQTTPTLHSRNERRQTPQTPQAQEAKGISTLPEEASGEYVLDGHGSVVQITIEHGRLSGYVTKMEGRTALTLFFDRSAVNGNRVSFTTKTVHGLWYSFRGRVVRGEAAQPSASGFYRLTGELKTGRGGTSETERVNLKSTPRMR